MKYLLLIAIAVAGVWVYYNYDYRSAIEIYIGDCKPTVVKQTGWTIENVYNERGVVVDTIPHIYTKTKYVCKDGIRWY